MVFRPSARTLAERATSAKTLAYVERFDHSAADPDSKLFSVCKSRGENGIYTGEIVDLGDIVQPCPLSPRFGVKATDLDHTETVLQSLKNCLCHKAGLKRKKNQEKFEVQIQAELYIQECYSCSN
jgi:hypothetical protein